MTADSRWTATSTPMQAPTVPLGWAGRIAAEAERLRSLGVEPSAAWCQAAGVQPEATGGAASARRPPATRRAAGLIRQLELQLAAGPTTAAALSAATGAGASAIRHHLREIAAPAGVVPARGKAAATQLWVLPGHPAEAPAQPRVPVLDRIVAWVADQRRPVTTREIAAGTGCPQESVANVCRRAEHLGLMASAGAAGHSLLWVTP